MGINEFYGIGDSLLLVVLLGSQLYTFLAGMNWRSGFLKRTQARDFRTDIWNLRKL
jgi:hypothetical protein